MIPHIIRPGRPTDLPFVVDSWVKRGAQRGERLRDATLRVRSILAEPTSLLRVACLPDDEDAILGWAVIRQGFGVDVPDTVEYAYVRKTARHDPKIEAALTRDVDEEDHGVA